MKTMQKNKLFEHDRGFLIGGNPFYKVTVPRMLVAEKQEQRDKYVNKKLDVTNFPN